MCNYSFHYHLTTSGICFLFRACVVMIWNMWINPIKCVGLVVPCQFRKDSTSMKPLLKDVELEGGEDQLRSNN